MRAAQGQCRAGDPADGLADHVFGTVERRGGFRRRPLGVAEPRRTVGDHPGGFEVDADFGNVAPHIGVVGQRLDVTFRLSAVDHPAQFVVGRGREAQINRGVRAPEPVQIGVPERPHVV